MEKGKHHHQQLLFVAVAAILIAGIASFAFAASPPVTVTMAVTGDPVPGATVTAKATVTINDGSTLQSIKWSQVGGVGATLTNTSTDTATVVLPARKVFREQLMTVLDEQPVANSLLPAYVPASADYTGGLQNRYMIAGVSNEALIDAGGIKLDIAVTTSSGAYHTAATVAGNLPWETSTGIRNVPMLLPVLLHAKTQATYNWSLTVPTGSAATLIDPTTQNPEFTPDVAGTYQLTVTDLATAKPVSTTVYAGTWKGIITGQDAKGRPVADAACMACHVKNTPHFDLFTPWAQSGHAEIFTQNVTTPAGHYSAACLSCHTVGYNAKAVKNNGIDEAIDWTAFLGTTLLTHGDASNWTSILSQFPATARMANIQCENCHGPQDSAAHMKKDNSRMSLSSDVCGSCHGEPTRHGRFQQWQLSAHANYTTALSEGTDPTCAKCHSAQGFIAWQDTGFSTANLNVTWTADQVDPQTCVACHDPHNPGTTSSDKNTNATVRVMGTTPMLMAGFSATNVGRGATCMTCHNGRRGLKNDTNYLASDASRAPHEGTQADIIMGQNLFFTNVGTRGLHSMIQDSCVSCHMESTDPPSAVALQNADGTFVGTNHTFYASNTICTKCHSNITKETVQTPVQAKLDSLKAQMQTAIKNVMQAQIRAGNTIDLNGLKTIKNASAISAIEFISASGRQGINVTLADGSTVNNLALNTVKVTRPAGTAVELYAVADPAIAKAGWNYFMVINDRSKGVHNPAFVNSALDVSTFAVSTINSAAITPAGSGSNNIAAIGGGLGNGAGAVSCKSAYVYWSEMAGHTPGQAGSQWRTDLVARNLETSTASLRFILHQAGGNLESTGTVNGGSQKAFEDLTATMGGASNIGALEICSDKPLLVATRIFNQADAGTYGQSYDGRVADLGYSAGQTISLIGLRQKTDAYRSNLVVTNGGTTEAQVSINLFDSTGKSLTAYTLTIPAGSGQQDLEPFKNRANAPDIDWGYATVTVVKGTNVLSSASLIDMKTNDPTTIPSKQ
jgi:hypothetical protein